MKDAIISGLATFVIVFMIFVLNDIARIAKELKRFNDREEKK